MSKRERTVSFGFHVSVRYNPRSGYQHFPDGNMVVSQTKSTLVVHWHVFGWSGRWHRRWVAVEQRTLDTRNPRARQVERFSKAMR
jgi:hypothetical protein